MAKIMTEHPPIIGAAPSALSSTQLGRMPVEPTLLGSIFVPLMLTSATLGCNAIDASLSSLMNAAATVTMTAAFEGLASAQLVQIAEHPAISAITPFVRRISEISGVRRVLTRVEEGVVKVWTIIDEPSIEVEDQIYDAQLALMDSCPGMLFDFFVIFGQGRNMIPSGVLSIFSRA